MFSLPVGTEDEEAVEKRPRKTRIVILCPLPPAVSPVSPLRGEQESRRWGAILTLRGHKGKETNGLVIVESQAKGHDDRGTRDA